MKLNLSTLLSGVIILWHVTLVIIPGFVDRWIEFTDWYFNIAVVAPPIVAFVCCTLIYLIRPRELRPCIVAFAIAITLAWLHWALINEAARIV